MDHAGSSKPLPSTPESENPVVAVGRKVKSILTPGPRQQPSVRILRVPQQGNTREPEAAAEKRVAPGGSQRPAQYGQTAKYDAAYPEAHRAATRESTSSGRFSDARNRAGSVIRSVFNREEEPAEAAHDTYRHDCYDPDTVDILDVVDPEVATLSTLTNVQNSLFVPSLGRFVNRRATYNITDRPREANTIDRLRATLKRITPVDESDEKQGSPQPEGGRESSGRGRSSTITSTLSESRYAVLPHGETLPGWTHADKVELDDLVRHQLHSRRAKFKRSMKGFSQYVRRPLGLFITVYATLITLFGLAWVLFLIGWISLGSKQDYVINIVDNVLVALFAIIGDGLAPFRAVDTYHMLYIMHYHRKTWKKRAQLGLPDLVDRNDLPEQRRENVKPAEVDLESLVAKRMPRGLARHVAPRIPKRLARRIVSRSGTKADPIYEYSVLKPEQQAKLEFHERKFSKSHTFYKPHETETHFAFPLRLLVAVVLLLDCHSLLQISLGACTWGIPYKHRPFALTTVILCCSITCNITGGILISVGDKRTRKKDVIERMMRQQLTSEAIEQMETRRLKEAEERGDIDPSYRKKLEEQKEEVESEEIKKSWKTVPLLPKTLLGKGIDHRQPSLPQAARRSNPNVASSSSGSGSSTPRNPKSKSSLPLSPVQEAPGLPSRPQPALKRDDAPREGPGQKVMRYIRRADLDRS